MPLSVYTAPLMAASVLVAAPPVLQVEGGTPDDQAIARMAFGQRVEAASLEAGLRAVRATDRFEQVMGTVLPDGNLHLQLHPWPLTRDLVFMGLPPDLKRWVPVELREGAVLGDLRLAEGVRLLQERLRGLGYPEARVEARREDRGRKVVVKIEAGPGQVVKSIQVVGDLPADKAMRLSGLVVGKTLWTAPLEQDLHRRFRKAFLSARRYEGQVEARWDAGTGAVTLEVRQGPVVDLAKEGDGPRLGGLKKILPLARADRYTPDLVAEGDRRILRLLLGEGYLDAQVTHRREVVAGTEASPERVRIVYGVKAGKAYEIRKVEVEGNREVDAQDLLRGVKIRTVWPILGGESASPDHIAVRREQVLEAYRQLGYADADVAWMPTDRGTTPERVLFKVVREGEPRLLKVLELDLPADTEHPWALVQVLPSLVDARLGTGAEEGRREIRATRRHPVLLLEEVKGREGMLAYRMVLDRPVPLVKRELARVINRLRQLQRAAGVQGGQKLSLRWDEGSEGILRLQFEGAPRVSVDRVVYQGADHTRVRALMRETELAPGRPLDVEALGRTQGNLLGLGGSSRVDVLPLEGQTEVPGPWNQGDVLVRMVERSPWAFTHSFGYDKGQGYHVGTNIQRLNLNGMGRTLDLGLRAGDGTLQIPWMRRAFPTGENPRSVDMYSLGYTDPWFSPGLIREWLPDRTSFRSEAAFVEERRDSYLVRKRRWQSGLQWPVGANTQVQIGLRYERVRVVSAIPDVNDEELNLTARMPGRATISAPSLQVTRDARDNPFDPTSGTYSMGKLEFANQLFGTSANTSFVKVDLRQQWNWPLGADGGAGVLTFGLRIGAAVPTAKSARELPLSERFFAGGPFTHRGVEPDYLGPTGQVPLRSTTDPSTYQKDENGNIITRTIPLGGQGLVLGNLEWRFPSPWANWLWGEVFVDSGQVYKTFWPEAGEARFPAPRTAVGVGVILKVGMPIKIEIARDLKRLLGRPQTATERETELKGILFSAGFQF